MLIFSWILAGASAPWHGLTALPTRSSLAPGLVRPWAAAFGLLSLIGGDRIGPLRSVNDNLPGRVLASGCGPHHPARFSLTALPLVERAIKASIAILPGIPDKPGLESLNLL